MELSHEQIERQDFVDNRIHELLEELLPFEKEIEWDIDAIGTIRDAITKVYADKNLCSEQQFYPYIELKSNGD